MTAYNVTTALAMLVGRFGLAARALAVAGRFAVQGRRPITAATLPGDSAVFGVLVLGTIVLVGELSFLPALALGPIVEALRR
jgi:K+-transporting ATPase ATPase A chain